MNWYRQNTDSLFQVLNSSEHGLSKAEAAHRLTTYGPNQLSVKRRSLLSILIEPFKSVFVGVLILAALVSFLSHETFDALIITLIICINSAIFYTQQYTTTRVLRTLKKHTIGSVQVLRGGSTVSVSSVDLVPGDIIMLAEGERIPADARIIHTDSIQLNESALTGESVPVHKHASTLGSDKQIYEQDNMVFQGTYVLSGTAKAIVVETGARTEFGKIASLTADEKSESPVQSRINSLITNVVKAVGLAALLVFVLSLARGMETGEALRFVLTLSVSAVPEGLPVALSVIIVLGMRRMAKKKALVRSFQAIEDVGLITTIATDKTGTLTKNHLTVVEEWKAAQDDVLKIAALSLDATATITDPLDRAIAEKVGSKSIKPAHTLYPFDLSLRMSGAYHASSKKIFIKGSPEHLLAKSKLTKPEHFLAESAMHKLASEGYRVIAFGYVQSTKAFKTLAEVKNGDVHFAGYLAFADVLRPEAAGAIRAAQSAGISVRLITGDHYETAFNIGKKIGLATHPDQVIQGTQLPKDEVQLASAIREKTVFARILPEDKFRILKALKSTEITAMTGDGVNDVPALSNAHVGFAMGSGSDIAKDAGGIVLLNDNFATIVKAIAEGRKIYDNIRKMLFYLLATSLGEVCTMVGALLFGLPLPVTAIQILWINLVTDTALVIPLGLEPEEDGFMKRPPRAPRDPLLGKILLSRMVSVALTMAVVTLSIVAILHSKGYEESQIQSIAFMSLIAAQWMNAFNARSEYKSSLSRITRINPGMIVGFIIAFSLQMLAMFGPLMSALDVVSVPIDALIIATLTMTLSVFTIAEIHKFITRSLTASR